MTDWQVFGGPLDGERFTIPGGRPVELPARLAKAAADLSQEVQDAVAVRALQNGADVATARDLAESAAFTYEPERGARRGRFIFTPAGSPRTDQQEDA